MIEKSPEQLNAWKTEMRLYEKGKRTKKPFGSSMPKTQYITYENVKERQTRFNPILQTYRVTGDEESRKRLDEAARTNSLMNHLKHAKKYERQFDIVNLHSGQPYKPTRDDPSSKKLGPIRNIFNVVNNQPLPDFHFKNRQVRLPLQRQKNIIKQSQKQFNIVTGIYSQNHQNRSKKEQEDETSYIYNKYWKTHDYDPVFGKYYSQEKQKEYQTQRAVQERTHGKDFDKKLPPSYVERQEYVMDESKPLPDKIARLDEKIANAKKRYQLKYVIEDEYGKRNVEDDSKYQTNIKNKVHNNRVIEEKSKEFNIVSNRKYPESRAEDLFGKKAIRSTWDNLAPSTLSIKTGGFNN